MTGASRLNDRLRYLLQLFQADPRAILNLELKSREIPGRE